MTIPEKGTTWKAAGLSEIDNRFYSRGGLAAILIRDNRGAATNISPYIDGVTNAVQTVTISGGPSGGTFTLTYDGQETDAIDHDATAEEVQAALEALDNIGAGNVSVTGGPGPNTPYVVEFVGDLGGRPVYQMLADGSSLSGGTTPDVTVVTTQEGASVQRHWSPFAKDGKLRDDLFHSIRVNGEWVTNPNPNEGFWLVGAVTEDGGIEREPSINQDNAMVLQSNFPFDTDLIEEGITINFTGVETLKPLMKRLRMNLPLSDANGNPIVEDPGEKDFAISKPTDTDAPERQIILLFARRKGGKFIYTAEGYSLCKLTDIGSYSRSKTDPDAAQLGFTVLPDPYFFDKDPANPESNELVPVLYTEWHAGDGWTAIGGEPTFPGSAPLAVATGATTATITFDAAEGAGDPFTYTVEKETGGIWSDAVIASVSENAGKVTITVAVLAPATTYRFRITATGTNGNSKTSQNSNQITTS